MIRKHSAFRALALALVTARVLAFAFAPVLELQIAGPGSSKTTVVSAGTAIVAPVHDPATCPACLLMHVVAYQYASPAIADRVVSVQTARFAPPSQFISVFSHSGFRSRAPPAPFV